jgi:hypothetical protein
MRRTRKRPEVQVSGGRNIGQEVVRQHVRRGNVAHTPLFRLILGLAMLFIMLVVACFSVLTTQNLIAGGDGSGVVLRWEVFRQPFDLMQGMYTGTLAIAIIVSWALLVLYLIVGALEVMTPDSRGEDKVFKTVIFALLALDGAATFEYLHILPDWYRWLFTILVPLCIGFFGKFGLSLLLGAAFDFFEEMK